MDVVHKRRTNRCDTETQRNDGDEPARPYPLASDVGWDLEDNIADIEDRQDRVVVVSFELEIFFQTRQTGVADIRSIDEAEKIEQRDRRDDVQINLQPKPRLGLGVELNKRMAISVRYQTLQGQDDLKTLLIRRSVSMLGNLVCILLHIFMMTRRILLRRVSRMWFRHSSSIDVVVVDVGQGKYKKATRNAAPFRSL
jgi:hypothetical protein